MASFLNRLAVHRTVLASFLLPVVGLPVFGLAPGVLASHCSGSPGAVSFLPDDAEIACRAILPQCFKQSDWADLCALEPSVAAGHPEACLAAGYEPGQAPQGR